MMSDHISEIINTLPDVEHLHFLELGTGDGTNFKRILCNNKKSVDLNGVGTHTMSTDQYFAEHGDDRFDITFIDADHSYAQVIKDYNNSIKMTRLVVLIHDMYPKDAQHAVVEHCGDSYKLLAQLINAGIDVQTLDCDSGLSFIRMPAKPLTFSDEFDRLSYQDFVELTKNHLRCNLDTFKSEFSKAMSFDKLGTIKRYPYKIPAPIKIDGNPSNTLIFYICVSSIWYLRMMVLSIYSILRNTDAKKYAIRVYLGEEFKGTPGEAFIKKCGIEVIYISKFIPRYTVPFLPENREFDACINMDCDAFALPDSDDFFSGFASMKAPLSCGLILDGDTMGRSLLHRKFQSRTYKNCSDDLFLTAISDFLRQQGKNADTTLALRTWNYGFLCQYRPKLLLQNDLWHPVYDFACNRLKTTCDETSTMLFYHLCSGGVYDITGQIPFCVGGPSYSAKRGIVHPIVGHECNYFEKNISLIRSCVEFPAAEIPDPTIRAWYLNKTTVVYPESE